MTPKVAIVYLAYKVRPYIEQVFLSLEWLDYPKERLEIIVVDNASPDGEAEWVRQHAPSATLFAMPTNEGFAGGNNIGINHALLHGADYVYLLNGDAKLDPGAIKEAVAVAEADKTIGSVQSLLRLWQDQEVLNSTGGMVHWLGFGFVRDNGFRDPVSEFSETRSRNPDIAYASGAAVLYRASVLREVGLLEPFYFMYHEDLELGWCIRLAGYRNVLAPRSVAFHHYEFRRSVQKYFWMERNRWLVHLSHLKFVSLVLIVPWMVAIEIPLIVFAAKGGWLREKLLVYAELIRPQTWQHIAKKRRESKIIRKTTDREIVRLWTGKIEHQETKNAVVDYVANQMLSVLWFILKRVIVW
jgi:hypothetical protein